MASDQDVVETPLVLAYMARRKRGLTKNGLRYWLVHRILHGGVPLIGGPKFPDVDDDPAIGLPDVLKEG